ncbi:hypothetical protein [Hyphomicrobium sp.]|uniref:hypothetical protein n=1 Tax=Hyphomicrobium sp. TaxID=82 RepID=UPI0025C6883F|nr:hypothetical protein [Hyphomicrobium sp.]MCC7253245.1 hypothetical protein [Hyphomicrobium sp.]
MYKAIGIILCALFIATFQISAASAGCGGGHGGYRASPAKLFKKQALNQSRARKARVVAAAKQKKAVQQASAKKAEPAKVAAAEPTPAKEETKTVSESITETSESKVNVASTGQSCTRFFAETGTTVTVDCAQQ